MHSRNYSTNRLLTADEMLKIFPVHHFEHAAGVRVGKSLGHTNGFILPFELEGVQLAFEFKWSPTKAGRFPKTFAGAYPDSVFETIHRDNFEDFLGA